MLPLACKPMAGHPLCAARESGIRDFLFVFGYRDRVSSVPHRFMEG